MMKGKGTRGMPGKGVRPPPNSGMQKGTKNRMQKRDFEKSEWTFVAGKEDLGKEMGATIAVAAGQSYRGQEYLWTLVRGDALAEDMPVEESVVYATDGSCRTCLFPMTKGTLEALPEGGHALKCALCGTKYSMTDGEVLDFLPKENPAQWAAAMVNEKKGPVKCGMLPTRVSQSGRIYLRLPDGTLPIPEKTE